MTNWSAACETAPRTARKLWRAAWPRRRDEISHWPEYDDVIVNTDVEKALGDIQAVLDAERLKRNRQTGISEFVGKLV